MTEESEDAYVTSLRDAVARAVAGLAADVDEDRTEHIWTTTVTPRTPGAATISLAYAGDDEVTLSFGRTHEYLWGPPAVLGGKVAELLDAVVAGRFEEAGWGDDAFVRGTLRDGTRFSLGRAHLPLPWRLRRVRTYEPYRPA